MVAAPGLIQALQIGLRRRACWWLALMVLLVSAPVLRAQTEPASAYPMRSLGFVVGYAPVGPTDLADHLIAQQLQEAD